MRDIIILLVISDIMPFALLLGLYITKRVTISWLIALFIIIILLDIICIYVERLYRNRLKLWMSSSAVITNDMKVFINTSFSFLALVCMVMFSIVGKYYYEKDQVIAPLLFIFLFTGILTLIIPHSIVFPWRKPLLHINQCGIETNRWKVGWNDIVNIEGHNNFGKEVLDPKLIIIRTKHVVREYMKPQTVISKFIFSIFAILGAKRLENNTLIAATVHSVPPPACLLILLKNTLVFKKSLGT